MRNTLKFALVAAIAALSLVSCEKEKVVPVKPIVVQSTEETKSPIILGWCASCRCYKVIRDTKKPACNQ